MAIRWDVGRGSWNGLAAVLLIGTVRCLPASDVAYRCEEDGTCLAAGFYCDADGFCSPLPAEDQDDAGTEAGGLDDGGSGDGGSTEPDAGTPDGGLDAGADGR